MYIDWMERHLKNTNNRIRKYCGPNFKFRFNRAENQFELWEKRGPLEHMVFPVNLNGEPLPEITDNEIYTAVMFVRRKRRVQDEEYFYKYHEYNKLLKPDDWVDPNPKEDLSQWKDTSPQVEGVKKVRLPVS